MAGKFTISLLVTITVIASIIILSGSSSPTRRVANSAGAIKHTSFRIIEITQGNYLHEGVHVRFDDPQHDDIANIGFILGEKCVAVIDTGGSVKIGQELHEAIRSITDLPICYVINTHVHFDHVLGNLAFVDEKPAFIGHAGLADAIEANRAFFLEQFTEDLGPDPSEKSVVGPDKTVENTLELDLGGRTLLLTAYPTAHSHADLTVLDQKTKTLWAGDLLFRERIPSLDGSLKGWLSAMDELKSYDVDYVIPGHGPSSSNWPEVMTAQEIYLNMLLDETRQAIANGLFMEEAIETIGNTEKEKWLLFDQHHRSNISRVFIELEWE